jgi:hypothetical protein
LAHQHADSRANTKKKEDIHIDYQAALPVTCSEVVCFASIEAIEFASCKSQGCCGRHPDTDSRGNA